MAFIYELACLKQLESQKDFKLEKGCVNALIGFAYFKLFLDLESGSFMD